MYWDGGINIDSSLKEKCDFYHLAKAMSDFLKDVILSTKSNVYIAEFLCENSLLFPKWSDLKKQKLFRLLTSKINRNKCYKLTLPDDSAVIDLIIESNFMYLSHVVFYLSESKTIIQPTCHTELIVYSCQEEHMKKIMLNAIRAQGESYLMLKEKTG